MNTYIRLGTAAIADVCALVEQHNRERKARVLLDGHSIGVTSLRMRTFARAHADGNLVCAGCGLTATFFAVEHNAFNRDPKAVNSPHVNLYGVKDGADVLFTHDHILARGLGGKDDLSNTQPMCNTCNAEKAIAEQVEVNLRRK